MTELEKAIEAARQTGRRIEIQDALEQFFEDGGLEEESFLAGFECARKMAIKIMAHDAEATYSCTHQDSLLYYAGVFQRLGEGEAK